MSHSFECRAVDGIHIVIHGVPGRSEAGQFTIFVVWNDVDSRDTCQAIDKQMIVSDLTAYFVNKVTSVSGVVSLFPYLLVDTFGIFLGIYFFKESSIFATISSKIPKRAL